MRSVLARFGIGAGAGLAKAATVPACAVCAAYPVLAGPLTAAGLFGAGVVLHNLLVLLAPLNLVFLAVTYRLHRRSSGLVIASIGVMFIMLHLAFHVVPESSLFMHVLDPYQFQVGMTVIWIGMALLAMGVILDWRAQRRPRPIVIR